MLSDIEIAQRAQLKPIGEVASAIGLAEEDLERYGNYKAKIAGHVYQRVQSRPSGKLILYYGDHRHSGRGGKNLYFHWVNPGPGVFGQEGCRLFAGTVFGSDLWD